MQVETKRRGVLLGCCALFAIAGIIASPAARGAYIFDDFEGDAPDAAPTSVAGTASGPTYQVKVVDSTTTPKDPFAASGNQSLMLRDQNGTFNSAAWWTGAPGGLQSGDLSIQFQLDPVLSSASPDQPYAYTVIALGNQLSSGGAGIVGSMAAVVDILSSDGTSPGGMKINYATSMTASVTLGAVHTLTMHFDVDTKQYSATLDGTPLTDGTNTLFPFYDNSVPNIDSVQVAAGWSSTDGIQVFYDNLSLTAVPEPASFSLLGLATGALMLKRRRA